MTAREFLALARRRWYVVALGLMLTCVPLYAVQHAAPVYWAKTSLLVLAPAKLAGVNVLQDNAPAAVAGLAVMDVNREPLSLRAASPDATLYGLGDYSDVLIQVRNLGGQWTPNAQPYIDIEATGPDPLTVERRVRGAVQQVRNAVARRQEQMRVGPQYRAPLEQTPPMISVVAIPPDRRRGLGSTLLAGVAITALGLVLVERLLRGRAVRPVPGSQSLPSPTTSKEPAS
jgi:hypothetical protein